MADAIFEGKGSPLPTSKTVLSSCSSTMLITFGRTSSRTVGYTLSTSMRCKMFSRKQQDFKVVEDWATFGVVCLCKDLGEEFCEEKCGIMKIRCALLLLNKKSVCEQRKVFAFFTAHA